MFEKLELTRMAQSLAAHAGARMALVAQNVAHADTPGYRARDLPAFADVYDGAETALRATRPGHIGTAAVAGAVAPGAGRGGGGVGGGRYWFLCFFPISRVPVSADQAPA